MLSSASISDRFGFFTIAEVEYECTSPEDDDDDTEGFVSKINDEDLLMPAAEVDEVEAAYRPPPPPYSSSGVMATTLPVVETLFAPPPIDALPYLTMFE